MRRTLGILAGVDRPAAVALVYTALAMTLLEYVFYPVRVEAFLSGSATGPVSLNAGLIWAGGCVLLYMLVPLLLVRFFHREPLAAAGYSAKGLSRHIWIYVGLYVGILPLVWLASREPDFSTLYPFVPAARTDTRSFLIWEAAYVAQFFALESFFRGYLLFTLEKRIGALAIFVMAVPYCMIHYHKPGLEAGAAILAGVALGMLALRLRSWYGGAILHSLVAVTMDSLARSS